MKVWNCDSLTSGAFGLTAIKTSNLSDGDVALTVLDDSAATSYWHRYFAANTAASNSPTILRPQDFVSSGNWVGGQISAFALGTTPTNATLSGGVSGFDFALGTDASHDLDFAPGFCRDSTNGFELSSTATITKVFDAGSAWTAGTGNAGMLDGSALLYSAGEYIDLYALLKTSDSSVDFGGLPAGGDIVTALASISGYDYYRWIGFARVNSADNFCGFTMDGDTITYSQASENVVVSGITTTSFVALSWSDVCPVARVNMVLPGVTNTTNQHLVFSADGTNTSGSAIGWSSGTGDTGVSAWSIYGNNWCNISSLAYYKVVSGTSVLLIQGCTLKR